jgi:hypothetical protein
MMLRETALIEIIIQIVIVLCSAKLDPISSCPKFAAKVTLLSLGQSGCRSA